MDAPSSNTAGRSLPLGGSRSGSKRRFAGWCLLAFVPAAIGLWIWSGLSDKAIGVVVPAGSADFTLQITVGSLSVTRHEPPLASDARWWHGAKAGNLWSTRWNWRLMLGQSTSIAGYRTTHWLVPLLYPTALAAAAGTLLVRTAGFPRKATL
ncbi:MAG TPA: hypothetical protein VEB22_10330 [Phycisphaerales bacterium]|nr:hypothetical protein [Phycisphaerales bacterium]